MKKLILFLIPVLLTSLGAVSQFKNDNVLYKTVDPADLCVELQKQRGALLLDVRSKGEHYDTSAFAGLNLGHFKGAKNITINELDKRIGEISEYRNKPVFIYCSHSQRSRRASKMLADSGFTKVFNVNGGLSAFHYYAMTNEDCIRSLYETANNYQIISFNQLCERVKKGKPFLLDVRSDSAYQHISADPKLNAYGTLKGALNIPFASLNDRLGSLPSKNTEIILIDNFGGESAKAAVLLKKNGYENVSMLIEGVDRILSMDSKDLACRDQLYISPVSYATLNATEFGRFANKHPDMLILDVRTKEEFSNKHHDTWRNVGHLRNAVNLPVDQLEKRLNELDRTKAIVIYAFSGGPEAFRAANILSANGYKKVQVLIGGLFGVRWAAGNVKGQGYLKDLVVDIPEMNQ